MARLPRFVLPGQPQHVIQRGNNRDIIFAAEDDYRFYLAKLSEACRIAVGVGSRKIAFMRHLTRKMYSFW